MARHDTEQIIDEFLGDNPRAAEWRALREALQGRLLALRRERELETDAAHLAALDAKIAAVDRQVAALATEEAAAKFVEDSIHVTLAKAEPELEDEGE